MPARDPAASPHLPLVLGTSPHDRSVLPSHVHDGVGRGRSSSSAFSRLHDPHTYAALATTHAPGPSAGTNAARRVSTPDGLVSKLFRRLSTSTDHSDDHHVHHPVHRAEEHDEAFEDDHE